MLINQIQVRLEKGDGATRTLPRNLLLPMDNSSPMTTTQCYNIFKINPEPSEAKDVECTKKNIQKPVSRPRKHIPINTNKTLNKKPQEYEQLGLDTARMSDTKTQRQE